MEMLPQPAPSDDELILDQLPSPSPEPLWRRIITVVVVFVLPIVSFPIASAFGPEWQNGDVVEQVGILLQPEVTRYFAPLIVIAWLCTMAAIVFESRIRPFPLLRYGVYSGIPLTLHFLIISSFVLVGIPIVVSAVLAGGIWAVSRVVPLIDPPRRTRIAVALIAALLVGVALVFPIARRAEYALVPVVVVGFSLLLAGPCICAAVAIHRSWRLAAFARADRARSGSGARWDEGLGIRLAVSLPWLGAYLWAWRSATAKAIEIYQALPTSPPHCFVATAAAGGHSHIVGSWPCRTVSGERFAVTKQLQTLKAGELACRAAAPRLHRFLRRLYDRAGPPLAARIETSPRRADVAYVVLKPCEWLLQLVVALAGATRATATIYGRGSTEVEPSTGCGNLNGRLFQRRFRALSRDYQREKSVAVRLRLMRMGKKKQPTYRVVAADRRSPRDGRFIEIVGTYNPRREPSEIKINNAKAVSWLRQGAQPSERVRKILEISGAWEAHTSGRSIEDLEAEQAAAEAAAAAESGEVAASAPAEEPTAEAPVSAGAEA